MPGRTRAGSALSIPLSAIDITDRLLRQLGRVVNVSGANAEIFTLGNTGFVGIAIGGVVIDPRDVSDRLARQLGRVVLVDAANAVLVGQKTMAASVPVVIASDQSTVKAREDLTAMTWVSAAVTAPAANAVIADTGALGAGDYDFDVSMCMADTTAALGKCVILEHRNAANAATLNSLAMVEQQGSGQWRFRRFTLAANERLRVINGAVAGAAASRALGAIGRRIS